MTCAFAKNLRRGRVSGRRRRRAFYGSRLSAPRRPYPRPPTSQIVYPACTAPSTRRILYYRVEYLMRPATLGTRGKKFGRSLRAPPRYTPARPLILFASIFAIGEGRIFYEGTPRYAIRYSACLPSRVTSSGLEVNARSPGHTPGKVTKFHELLSGSLNNRLFGYYTRFVTVSPTLLEFNSKLDSRALTQNCHGVGTKTPPPIACYKRKKDLAADKAKRLYFLFFFSQNPAR